LAQETRDAYAVLLRGLCPANCPGLLITVSYPPDAVSPPPFLVSREEIDKLYGHWAAVERLGTGPTVVKDVAGSETAWHIRVR
jgi:hypothetical protein